MTKVQVTERFLDVVRKATAKAPDNHGFGYAILGKDGSLGGERTMRVERFSALTKPGDLSAIERLPIVKPHRNRFGKLTAALANPKSFIAHGRFSTNTVSLENTHPFFNGNLALIHNGVVSDASGEMKGKLKTSNDTEILFRYWEHGGMEAVEKSVYGYYGLAILDAETGKLHVVRDSRAYLNIAWVRTIGSYMIATTAEIIGRVCHEMKWKHDGIDPLVDDVHAVFDGNTIESHRTIYPLNWTPTASEIRIAESALGTPLEEPYYRTADDDKAIQYHSELARLEALDLENDDDEDVTDLMDEIASATRRRKA